jgi:hypothetical protein
MSMKEAYQKKMKAQLDVWSAEIDKLKAQAAKMEADTEIRAQREIDDLRAKRGAAAEKLARLERAGDDAWEDVKAGVEGAWDTLASAMKSASARFK